MNNVDKLRDQVEVVFEEAAMRLAQAIRVVMADHSHKGLIRSGATIKRVVRAAEEEAVTAIERSRGLIAGSRSVTLRTRLNEFVDHGVGRIRDLVNGRLAAIGLGDKAGQVLLDEALARAQRPPAEPITSRLDRLRKSAGKVARYVGHNILLALVMAVAGGIATAFALKAMNLD